MAPDALDGLQKLIDGGLKVQLGGFNRDRYAIYRGFHPSDDPITGLYDDLAQLYEEDGSWIFMKWEYIPGPGYDDFWWQYATMDEACEAAYEYYFGSPTLIAGWLIPLHSHPELSVNQVKAAIEQANPCTPEDFLKLAEERRTGLSDNWRGWPQALKWHFLTCSHESDPTLTLRLRRDMQEAFIVREEGD